MENWHPSENVGMPRAMRWAYKQGALKVDALRAVLDRLTPVDVVWRPFEDHRQFREFDELAYFRGGLCWGGTYVLYLADRCLRQFGLIQYIPRSPTDIIEADVDVNWIGYDQSVVDVVGHTTAVTFPSETVENYLDWYYRVSHPRLVPPPVDEPRQVPVPQFATGPSDPKLARISALIHHHLQKFAAEEDDPQFADLFTALHLCNEE